jgi:hypothetical protein
MKALLFFLLGIGIALLYLFHLRVQLHRALKGGRGAMLWSFPVRFTLLGVTLGLLFAWDAPTALYAAGGVLAGRFAVFGMLKAGAGRDAAADTTAAGGE